MILRPFWLLAGLAPIVAAYPKFSKPASGATVAAGTIAIEWDDNGDSPATDQLLTYQLFLVAGGNEDAQTMNSILVSNGQFAQGSTASGSVAPGFAGPTKNGYYLKMVAVATQGGTITIFSNRFSISGMTGVFPPAIEAAVEGASGASDVPDTINSVVSNQQNANPAAAAGAGAGATGDYAIPYSMQTGPTKFAPMPPVPATKITKKNPTPLYPTSAFNIAVTKLPTPVQVWTNTMSGTFSASSVENTVAAADMPTDTAMARFLARWAD